VAREYGIPAVLNIPLATQRIPDGRAITLDGGEGTVRID
jgi:phosphohistidine swiveling domain-containing protein